MFAMGGTRMYDRAKRLLAVVAKTIKSQPNKVRVTGHTDSTPFRSKRGGYGNWELSSDRAHAARRALVASGLKAERIASVASRSDRDPLLPADPANARNRRIGIVLLSTIRPSTTKPKPKPKAKKQAPKPADIRNFQRDWTGPRVR